MKLKTWYHSCSAGYTLRGEHSPPSGKPVLHFLHGNGFCGRTYSPMLEALADDFDLFLSDVQGHGDSDRGERFHGWNRTADLCIEAWQAHAPKFEGAPLMLSGHSFGGALSALMMAHQPTLARRAVLLDPVLFTPAMIGSTTLSDVIGLYSRKTLGKRASKRRRHWPDRETVRKLLEGRGMFEGWTDEALQAYLVHGLRDTATGGVELKCCPRRKAEIFGSFPKRLWSSLARVKTPTRVLYGENTFPFLASAVSRWCTINPHASAQLVPGGHCFMQENPRETAALIRNYLLED